MKLSSQNRTALDFILWTLLAILLGLILSFSFLPFFGVMPWAAIQIMFSEVFANGYSAGNVLVKTTPMILTGLAFAFTYKAKLFLLLSAVLSQAVSLVS